MSDEPVWRFLPRSCCRHTVMTRLCDVRPLTNFSHVGPFRLHQTLPPIPSRPTSDGRDWIHEIKHDGYRLITRNGHDWSPRYPLIVEAVDRLKVRSCLIDGEAVACNENGLAVFERLQRQPSGKHVFLYAFDLLELDGQNLRREPLETRKATLASLLRGSLPGLRLNEHLAHDGESVFRTPASSAWKGIVSEEDWG